MCDFYEELSTASEVARGEIAKLNEIISELGGKKDVTITDVFNVEVIGARLKKIVEYARGD